MSNLKVTVEGKDRQTLIKLVRMERRNLVPHKDSSTPQPPAAVYRAVDFYEEHLIKLQKRLDPKNYPYK